MPRDILDELCARFIINIPRYIVIIITIMNVTTTVILPSEEKENMVRVCFQIELAHWFFIDFYVTGMPELKLVSAHFCFRFSSFLNTSPSADRRHHQRVRCPYFPSCVFPTAAC